MAGSRARCYNFLAWYRWRTPSLGQNRTGSPQDRLRFKMAAGRLGSISLDPMGQLNKWQGMASAEERRRHAKTFQTEPQDPRTHTRA